MQQYHKVLQHVSYIFTLWQQHIVYDFAELHYFYKLVSVVNTVFNENLSYNPSDASRKPCLAVTNTYIYIYNVHKKIKTAKELICLEW